METVELKLMSNKKRAGSISRVYYAPSEGTVTYVHAFEWKATIVTDEDDSIVHDKNEEPLYTYEKVYLYNEDGSPMMVAECDIEPIFTTRPRQALLEPEEDTATSTTDESVDTTDEPTTQSDDSTPVVEDTDTEQEDSDASDSGITYTEDTISIPIPTVNE